MNEAMIHVPTLRERAWRKLGFRYHLGEEPAGPSNLEGWMQTNIRLDFSIADRIRLLLTGRLRVVSTVYTDTPSANIALSRVDWQIRAPGE